MTRLILAVTLAVTIFVLVPSSSQASDCQFLLGFKMLRDMIPDTVGDCKVNQHYNPQNGDALQETSKGLLVWRKSDNFTAFTDGYRSWVNGPYGLQQRLNTERFRWESDPPSAPVTAPPTPTPTVQAAPNTGGLYRVTLTRKARNLYKDTGGALFVTRYCLELALGERAIYDSDRSIIQFERDKCDVDMVITKYFESRINGTFEGWDGRTVFPLTNGQVWQQASYSYWYHYAFSPQVIVYEMDDAVWMKVEDVDETIVVRRIR